MFDNEPMTEYDIQLPDDLLLNEIERQISLSYPVHTFSKNFLDIFYKRQLIKINNRESEDDEDDPDAVEKDAANLDNCYRNVILNLKQRCGILIDTGSGEYDPKIINTIYSVFVFRLHRNMRDFLVASIKTNKAMFAKQFDGNTSSNISMKSARRTFANKIDAIIAVYYRNIVDIILQDPGIMHPENVIDILCKTNPEDYELRMITELYNVVYLGFDIPAFQAYIRNVYLNVLSLEDLKNGVIEWLLPSFPQKTQNEENDNAE
jgi:hypothetical protein